MSRTTQGRRAAPSPVIMPGLQPALLTAALAGLLALAPLGRPALLPGLVLLQVLTAAGWFRLNGMWPARQGIALAFAAGLTADAAVLLAPRDAAATAVLGTLGVWFLLVVILQLRHHEPGPERMDSLTATAAATLLTVLAAGFLAAAAESAEALTAAAAAVATAAVVRALLPVPWLSPAAAWLAAAGAGTTAGQAAGLETGQAALLGALAGGCALIGLRTAAYDFPSRFVHFTAGVALPLTAAAPAVYVVARFAG